MRHAPVLAPRSRDTHSQYTGFESPLMHAQLTPVLRATTLAAERFELFGQEVALVTDTPSVAAALASLYQRQLVGDRPVKSGRPAIQIRVLGGQNGSVPVIEALNRRFPVAARSQLEHMAHLVMVSAAAAAAVGQTVLHAGAVARDGRAVAIVGPSGWGKSTLTIELVRRGWSFLTDDFAPIGRSGWVEPFPRRVGITDASLAILGLAPPSGATRAVGAAGRAKWMLDIADLFPTAIGSGGRLETLFVMASSPAAAGGAQRWRVRMDHVPGGMEESVSRVGGVQSAVRHDSTGLELQVAHGASVLAWLDVLSRERGASIASVDSVPWSDPVFGDLPEATQLPVSTALDVALAHSVTLSGRRLFGRVTRQELDRSTAFLGRAATASGLKAFRLLPGALSATADLIEDLTGP